MHYSKFEIGNDTNQMELNIILPVSHFSLILIKEYFFLFHIIVSMIS